LNSITDFQTEFTGRAFEKSARLFSALGDENRLRLLVLLSHGEKSVTEIATATNEGISTISQRLKLLKSEYLVASRREGKQIFYRLADQHVQDIIFAALHHAVEPEN
jgi:ArsR family transcriptional regulator